MSKLEFSTRPWTGWDAETQVKLRACTLAIEDPDWAPYISGMNKYPEKYPALLDTWVALLDGEPIGWALRVHTTYKAGQGAKKRGRGWVENNRPVKDEAMFYVHPDHRRKGIGRALRALIEQEHGPGMVTPWDDASEGFYGTFKGWELHREEDPPGWDATRIHSSLAEAWPMRKA